MSHIILINSKLDQVETHKVDSDTFLEVYGLLHQNFGKATDGLSFGAASRVEEVADAMRNSEPAEETELEELEELPPALEEYYPKPDPEPESTPPTRDDKAFTDSLAALFT